MRQVQVLDWGRVPRMVGLLQQELQRQELEPQLLWLLESAPMWVPALAPVMVVLGARPLLGLLRSVVE